MTMDNLARKQSLLGASQESGTLLRCEGEDFIVRTDRGDWRAHIAASCLLHPEPGDRVLLVILEPNGCYILAVLDRGTEQASRLRFTGDLSLELPDGRLDISAGGGLDLSTPASLSLSAGELRLSATETSLISRQVDLVGGLLRAEWQEVKALAQSCDSIFERVVQRVKHAYRFVTDTDYVRTGRMDYAAEQSVRVHGKDTLITAERLAKMDGDQIHLG